MKNKDVGVVGGFSLLWLIVDVLLAIAFDTCALIVDMRCAGGTGFGYWLKCDCTGQFISRTVNIALVTIVPLWIMFVYGFYNKEKPIKIVIIHVGIMVLAAVFLVFKNLLF